MLTANGVPYLWGNNSYGQLGNYPAPYATAVTSPTTDSSASGYTRSLGTGYLSSYISAEDGSVWSVGDNTFGEFGTGSTSPVNASLLQGPAVVSQVSAVMGGVWFTAAMTH